MTGSGLISALGAQRQWWLINFAWGDWRKSHQGADILSWVMRERRGERERKKLCFLSMVLIRVMLGAVTSKLWNGQWVRCDRNLLSIHVKSNTVFVTSRWLSSMWWFRGPVPFHIPHLARLHQPSRRKSMDNYMWEFFFYGPYLEVAHIIVITFHLLAHRHMATPTCNEEWKMLPKSVPWRKERVWRAAVTNTC